VTVIAGAANQVVATVPAGDAPCALCHNSTDNKVYCANEEGDSVIVIDGATNSSLATVSAGDVPSALCYNLRNNKVQCANEYSYNVTVGRENAERRSANYAKCPPTVIRGVLTLQSATGNLQSEIVLLDAIGCKVADLKPGMNDVSALSPRVYFLRGL
jgi:YVTN family beta-propeller protein